MKLESGVAYNKMPASNALKIIDNELIKIGKFERIDRPDRTKAHFFNVLQSSKQFAVIVGEIDTDTGEPTAQQTRILFEEYPPEIEGVQRIPVNEYFNGSSVKRQFSHLAPPNQFSVLVNSEIALRKVLNWYTGVSAEPEHKSIVTMKISSELSASKVDPTVKTIIRRV
jgi:hypothetical protein